MAKNIIIGVGNLLFCDDGVGVIASHYLKKKIIVLNQNLKYLMVVL